MSFYIRNLTNSRLYVAFGYRNTNCSPVVYAKIGWYTLDPGQIRQLASGFSGGQTYYLYAEDAFGRRWGGPYFTQVPNTAFHWCWNTGCSTCRSVGFDREDVPPTSFNHIVSFAFGSGRGKSKSGNNVTLWPSNLKNVKPRFIKPMTMSSKQKKVRVLSNSRVALPSKLKRKQ